MKRTIKLVVPATLLLAMIFAALTAVRPAQAQASTFPDVPASNPARTAIESLAGRGIVSGMSDGYFRPDQALTRGQATKILVRWSNQQIVSGGGKFSDVDSTFVQYVNTASALGWIYGYPDGTFRPSAPMSREQMAIVLLRSVGLWDEAAGLTSSEIASELARFADGGAVSSGARPYVAVAARHGLLTGDTSGRLNPAASVTRGQFCLVLKRAENAGFNSSYTRAQDGLAAFMDQYLFRPHNSPITGEMVLNNQTWYGVPALAQVVILTAETSLGDPEQGGPLARHYNFGCIKYRGTDSAWGRLSNGSISVAGSDWYSFPSAEVGMAAFGRYLKAAQNGYYLSCLTRAEPDWRGFASVYYGEGVSGFENYVATLTSLTQKYRDLAAKQGVSF